MDYTTTIVRKLGPKLDYYPGSVFFDDLGPTSYETPDDCVRDFPLHHFLSYRLIERRKIPFR